VIGIRVVFYGLRGEFRGSSEWIKSNLHKWNWTSYLYL